MNNTTLEKRIDWPILLSIIAFHILAGVAMTMITVEGLVSFVILYAISVLGITMGFHRYYTHHSFKANKWFGRLLGIMGTLALQGSVKKWVAHHRLHHAGSDTESDPHNANSGFWYSHLLWMLTTDPKFNDPKVINRLSRDIMADPFLVFLSRPIVYVSMQIILGVLLWWGISLEAMMWGIWVRVVAVWHVTWFVNSACHIWGYKNFELVGDRATNNWWVGLLAFGEGWHNNHHAIADSARHGLKWWEFDITWQVIKLSEAFGLVTEVKVAEIPEESVPEDGLIPPAAAKP